MRKSNQSRISDNSQVIPSKNDINQDLFDALREARLNRHLTQQELARKRAAMDPRLSTIDNVARALDLELMLIPRHLISAVVGLQHAGSDSARRPMYALGDDDAESDQGDPSHLELGSTDESRDSVARQRRRTEEPE